MGRRAKTEIESAGSDSFLDVVTNIVGILIILVMVVGERARHILVPAIPKQESNAESLQPLQLEAIEVERDVDRVAAAIRNLDDELAARRKERELVGTIISVGEQELAAERARLDAKKRASYELDRDLALAQNRLAELERLHTRDAAIRPASLKVESYPTPLAKPVDGNELHLQLRRGRVAVVPIEELVDRLKRTAQSQVGKLRDYPELTDTVGPVDGFRMRYTLVRVDARGRTAHEPGGGSFVQLDHWELVPVASDLGEPWEEALKNVSRLRAKLDQINPRQWTVTLWVYPDSFDAFRALRKEFYELGYHVAGRPLPDDIYIGGSPRGSKSAAQ
jgi:hypothetical protein